MILAKRPDIERFLARPDPQIRAALIYGRDLGVVHDRGRQLAAKLVANPDDPFDVSQLTDGDIDADAGRLEGELAAQSLMGGRRLVRLRFATEKAGPDRNAAEALTRHAAGELNPDAFLMAVAVGAASDFLTPIGHQCNTLVMAPGGYKFSDYPRLGAPLSVVVLVAGTALIAAVWGLRP